MKAIGIDLGTTNSVAAIDEGDGPLRILAAGVPHAIVLGA